MYGKNSNQLIVNQRNLMKVLQVNCVYKRGSTGKIVADIHKVLLNKGIESVVCYGRQRGQIESEPHVYKFCTEFEGNINHVLNRFGGASQFGSAFFSTQRLISIIRYEKPDVVHLQCINGYSVNIYKILKWLAKENIKTVVTNHAEFLYTGSCGHAYECDKWTKNPGCGNCPILREASDSMFFDNTSSSWIRMKEAFDCFKTENLIFTAVSPWVKTRFEMSPITNKFRCEVVLNGVETSIFKYKSDREVIRQSFGIRSDKKMIFHATASFDLSETSLKGGRYILELAKSMLDVEFVVAALRNDNVDNCPSNLKLIGATKSQEILASLYSAADLTVIVSRRETFSMITAESLCCGTPVVGFKAGGPESIALTQYSEFVDYGYTDKLKECIMLWIDKHFDKMTIADETQKRYSKEVMAEKYLSIYHKINSENR